jgi:hypothetical protein
MTGQTVKKKSGTAAMVLMHSDCKGGSYEKL